MSDGSGELPARFRKRLWTVAKWSLTLVVLGFVAEHALKLWHGGSAGEVDLHIGWLLLAGLLYTIGWTPSVWYWRTLLSRMGDEISWPAAFRAYYCGHLGKYVPGKALVPVIRGHMTAAAGGRFRVGALATVYETLVMMGVGAEVAVALIPFLLPDDSGRLPDVLCVFVVHPGGVWLLDHPWILPGVMLLFVLVSMPVVARLFAVVARKIAPVPHVENLVRPIDSRTIGAGVPAFCLAWVTHGAALWATLCGVGADVSLTELPAWTACVALPMVVGFLAIFAPGGVGVREGVLIAVLQFHAGIDARQAVAAAFLLRLVGLVAEVIVAAVLYYGVATRNPLRPSPETGDIGLSASD